MPDKVKSICLVGFEVESLLSGKRTLIRRPVAPCPAIHHSEDPSIVSPITGFEIVGPWCHFLGTPEHAEGQATVRPMFTVKSPYGGKGGLLWVREAWLPDPPCDGTWADVAFNGCKDAPLSMIPERFRNHTKCIYKATWNGSPLSWKSPVAMPRWASRLTLEITSQSVQKVQDITEDQAKAEGIREPASWMDYDTRKKYDAIMRAEGSSHYQVGSRINWQSQYGYDSWFENPWVWMLWVKLVS